DIAGILPVEAQGHLKHDIAARGVQPVRRMTGACPAERDGSRNERPGLLEWQARHGPLATLGSAAPRWHADARLERAACALRQIDRQKESARASRHDEPEADEFL